MRRTLRVWRITGQSFGDWLSPVGSGLTLAALKSVAACSQRLDPILYPELKSTKIVKPIVIAGLPRTGSTFLQRFLHENEVATGQELWQLLFPSVCLQRLIRPFLGRLESFSPLKDQHKEIHKMGMRLVETDDASLMLHRLDGFFLYGFFLAWDDKDHFQDFDRGQADRFDRNLDWLEACWRRTLFSRPSGRALIKMFSLGADLPRFLRRFPGARIIYTARDPLRVIPSTLSLVQSTLSQHRSMDDVPPERRSRWASRLCDALIELMRRFHRDMSSGALPKSKLMILPHRRLRLDFDSVMGELFDFAGVRPSSAQLAAVRKQIGAQLSHRSGHKYSLAQFGLDEDRVREECQFYEPYWNSD